jgi:hypothetical protein
LYRYNAALVICHIADPPILFTDVLSLLKVGLHKLNIVDPELETALL